ncbi:uncharacterized protein LOC135501849 isoform X2 [Lineus longissimus]|uniref:uncharacterized protein LOC135501849 isoform X2 n=1 Tax=Lineus longissimus TaxID=88925 RepID=UPI002B4DF130
MSSYCGACIGDQDAAESEVIRKRMLYLMGTDVCRINDKKFIERLQVRVQDEYEKEQENKERQLAEKERQRQRRLISDGVMTAEQLREQDSTKWRKQRRTRTPPPGEEQDRKLVQEKARPISYHDKKDKDKGKHKGSKEEENQQTKEDEDGDDNSQKEKGDDEKQEGEGDENGADGENQEGEDGENRNGTEEEGAQGQEQEIDDSEGWHCDSDRPNYRARNDDPLIKKLRYQETTGGIYHTANEVLLGEPCGEECKF